MARHLITSAIPYINGVKHLGNLVGSQLPADLYARYLRGRGHEVMFICATDEHGTPAELAAAKAGQPVADYCAEMHAVQAELGRGFRLSFDHFGRSSSGRNHALTQHFAGRLAEAGLIAEVQEIIRRFEADCREHLESGRLKFPIDRTFGLFEAAQAQAYMEENRHFGKIVLVA